MTHPTQPSLEEWEVEISNLCKKALEDEFYGEGEVSFKRRVELELNIAIIVKSLISQAKAQGAEEERKEVVKMIKSLRLNTVSSDVLQAQRNITDFLLRMLTPQKEEA